jgi:hypothetical protein|tara:strand:+ start:715 stop:1332 length:618 start_codon:yes stop_codon:yes gene_type:complete
MTKTNDQPSITDATPMHVNALVVPIIEDQIPIPKSQKDALLEMTTDEEIGIRAETIKVISDINGEPIEPTEENVEEAHRVAKQMMENPETKPEFATYPNETMAYLAGMVAQTNCMLVKDMADYKLYVLNNAVQVHESSDNPKEKLMALRMIGEMDGVDAFKKKTEVTHINKTGEELEKELRDTIEHLKGKVIEGEVIVVEDEDDD